MSEYGHKVQVWSADWDAAHARISALEAALRKIIDEGDYTAPEGMKRIARTALETQEEPHGMVTHSSINTKCEKCGEPLLHKNHMFDAQTASETQDVTSLDNGDQV